MADPLVVGGMHMMDAIRETIRMGVHNNNYKQGAFKHQIPETASVLEALNVFLSSPLLSDSEKAKVTGIRKIVTSYLDGEFNNLSKDGVLMRILPAMSFSDIFSDDMRKRGSYVPPDIMTHAYDPETGKVSETTTLEHDGTVRKFSGGNVGAVPGAPAGFNEANTKHFSGLGLGPKGYKNGKASTGTSAGKAGEKKGSSSKDTSKTKFGEDFERNMRNAFR